MRDPAPIRANPPVRTTKRAPAGAPPVRGRAVGRSEEAASTATFVSVGRTGAVVATGVATSARTIVGCDGGDCGGDEGGVLVGVLVGVFAGVFVEVLVGVGVLDGVGVAD